MRPLCLLSCALVAIVACTACPASTPVPDPNCGERPDDWCASAPGDPCGAHHDSASCRADARCEGKRYEGESAVACRYTGRCFASNCPTVGCVSRCELLPENVCRADATRCNWRNSACVSRAPCD